MNKYGQQVADPGEDFRVADRLEVLDLIWRFTMALDIGDRAMFESCFADPVLWDLSDNPVPLTGGPADKGPLPLSRSEFVELAFGAVGAAPTQERFVQHCVNNPLITFTAADTATVLAHLVNPFHARTTDADGRSVASTRSLAGLYHIDARRDGDRWRLSALRLSLYTV